MPANPKLPPTDACPPSSPSSPDVDALVVTDVDPATESPLWNSLATAEVTSEMAVELLSAFDRSSACACSSWVPAATRRSQSTTVSRVLSPGASGRLWSSWPRATALGVQDWVKCRTAPNATSSKPIGDSAVMSMSPPSQARSFEGLLSMSTVLV